MKELIPIERVENRILLIRGQKVMIDRDLAELYAVPTKRLNEQVKRNMGRFPDDFMFQLSEKETGELVANCDRFKSLKHSSSFPYVFTEQGVAMLSSVLNSERAIAVNIVIMRTFVKIRQLIANHKELAQKLDLLEDTVLKHIKKHNTEIKAVFDIIKKIMAPTKKRIFKIGFLR
jgi:hypothetical protein